MFLSFVQMKSYQILKGMSCDIFYFLIVIKSHRKTIFYNYCVFIWYVFLHYKEQAL